MLSMNTGAALLVFSGALGLFLGFPNPFAQVPVFVLAYPAALSLLGSGADTPLCALRRGWLCGLLGSSAALYWLAVPVHDVGGLPWVLAVPCALAVGAYVGFYGGLFALLARRLRGRSAGMRCLVLGLGWFLLEQLRGFLFTGFPWLVLSAAFVPWPAVIQAAAYIGSYALSGLLAATACLPAEALRLRTRDSRRFLYFGCALLSAGMLAGGGMLRLGASPAADASCASPVRVALVQGNIDQNQKWEPAYQTATLTHYLRLSEKILSGKRPDLLIWPETSMPFYFQIRPEYAARIRDFVREHGVPLLLGAPGYDETAAGKRRVFNRAFLLGADGRILGFYDKKHLVPFGEYLPPWLDHPALEVLFQGVGAFAPGNSERPLHLGNLALGVLICYETIFQEEAQARTAAGAELLVNISNDAWFGRTSAPEQHLQLSVLRAVEQGRALVRATNTGFSALIDPMGRIQARSGLMRAEVLEGEVTPQREPTLFHRIFLWPAYAAAILLLLTAFRCPESKKNR